MQQMQFNFSKESVIKKWKFAKLIAQVDVALTSMLLKEHVEKDALFSLICHLSQSLKSGHLCIQVKNNSVYPKPNQVWELENDYKASQEEWAELEKLIIEGFYELPPSLFSIGNTLVRFENLLYFQKFWDFESTCLHEFKENLQNQPKICFTDEKLQTVIQDIENDYKILKEQKQALLQLGKESLTVISGGPGTGKTFTAGLLVKAFWNALTENEKKKVQIALAAPTGKAAANLQKSFTKATVDLHNFPPLTATTLHTLLKVKKGIHTKPEFLSFDLLIVDECSMIDIKMMSLLLQSIKPGSRLILLGDAYQLPSVEAGSFFKDLYHLCKPSQWVQLKKCLRTDLEQIVELAEEVKQGHCKAALQRFDKTAEGVTFKSISKEATPLEIKQSLLKKMQETVDTSLNSTTQFCILSPLRKGPLGSDQINQFFYLEMEKKASKELLLKSPIIISANDSKKDLYNGDMGFLIKHNPIQKLKEGDYALIGSKKLPALLLPRFDYAYCLSVHKSQGSEFDHIILLLPEGSENFGREMIYTAITRAKKSIEIWSYPEIFEQVIQNSIERLSRTNSLLKGKF